MMMVYVCGGGGAERGAGGYGRYTALTPAAVKIKISCECRFSGSKEHIKEPKLADSVLLSLFMCSYVIGQHCPRPRASASAELNVQTDSE